MVHGKSTSRGHEASEPTLHLPRINVDVVIPTKNEEAAIAECIGSLRNRFVNVFVVDSESTDRTTDIAVQSGAVAVDYVWDGKYPKKKQWCLDNLPLSGNWVLFLDADERATPEFIDE